MCTGPVAAASPATSVISMSLQQLHCSEQTMLVLLQRVLLVSHQSWTSLHILFCEDDKVLASAEMLLQCVCRT